MNDKFVKLKTSFSAHCISGQKVRIFVVRSVQKVYFLPKIPRSEVYKSCVSDQIQWSEMTTTVVSKCYVKKGQNSRVKKGQNKNTQKVYF